MKLKITRTNSYTGMVEMTDGKRFWQAIGPDAEAVIRKFLGVK